MEYSVCVCWFLVSMLLLGPLNICASKKAILPLLLSIVNVVSGNTWLMYEKEVFTSVRFMIAQESST